MTSLNELSEKYISEFLCSAAISCKTSLMITRRSQLPQGVLLHVYIGKEVVTFCLVMVLSDTTEVAGTTKSSQFLSTSGLLEFASNKHKCTVRRKLMDTWLITSY